MCSPSNSLANSVAEKINKSVPVSAWILPTSPFCQRIWDSSTWVRVNPPVQISITLSITFTLCDDCWHWVNWLYYHTHCGCVSYDRNVQNIPDPLQAYYLHFLEFLLKYMYSHPILRHPPSPSLPLISPPTTAPRSSVTFRCSPSWENINYDHITMARMWNLNHTPYTIQIWVLQFSHKTL